MKEIKMYDNASQTLKDESMAKHILKNRVMKCIFSTFFKLFIIGAVLTGLVTICVVKFLDIPRAPKGYVPAYLRYAKVIIENDRIGVKVKNGHVYKALLHASDCPCHFTGKDSVNNPHQYDKLIEAVRYYDAQQGIELVIIDKINKKKK